MRCVLVIAIAMALTELTARGDWRAQLTPQPGSFPLPRPLTATYQFGWSSFTAASADVSLSRQKGDQLMLAATGQTTGFVRTLWRLDFTYESRVAAASLLPIRMRQTENYGNEKRRTELDFTPEKVIRLRETKPGDKGLPKKKKFKFPKLRDLHAALLFARSQPLRVGDTIALATYPSTDGYFAILKVLGREPIEVPAGKFNALKVEVKLSEIAKEDRTKLIPHQKFKRAFAWLSDDADRLLLKVDAEIFVGSVWVELANVKFAGP